MNTITAFLAASMLYATIPFALLIFDREPTQQVATIMSLTIGLGTLWCVWHPKRGSFVRLLLNPGLFLASALNLFGIIGFIWLVSSSRDTTGAIFTLVIVESWPIAVAIAYPLLKIGLSRRIDPGSIVVGCLAVFGIALIGRTELENQTAAAAPNLLGFAVPVLAMLSMTVSTMAKAKYVDMAQKNHDVGPFNSFFLMYFQALPFLPLMLWPLLRNGYAGDDVAFASDLSIVVLNIASAILFSYGTLWLRDNRDWFVWFFAPVFSVAFYCLYQARMPEPFETVGIGLIVGSNLLLSLNTNNRLSYKYAVICLMIIGAFCSFQPIAPFDQYYDTLAVLSIFVSVTLSFMLSRVAGRAEHEVGLFQQAINSAAGHPSAPQIIATLTRFQNSSEPVHTARLHRTLIRMRAPDDVLNLTRQIGVSRSRGMEISNLFSLTTAIVAIVVIVLVGRPVGWQHDFFALMFAPSVVYAYFYLLDLDRSRNEAEIKTLKTRDGGLFTTFGRKRNRLNSRNTRWSIVLIVFLIMNFLVAFTAKGPL